MTAWWNGEAVLFDLETTGVDTSEAHIITAAVVHVMPRGQSIVNAVMARPERPIPAEATAIHGITTEHAMEYGAPREHAVNSIAQSLIRAGGVTPVVGHNAAFDLTILDREMRRLGIGSLGVADGFAPGGPVTVRIDGRQVGAVHVIDTLVLDKAVDPYRKGSRKLVDVAAHYGVPIQGDAHSADADALAAGRIAWAIAGRADAAADYLAQYGRDPMIHHDHRVMRWYGNRRKPLEVVESFATLSTLTLPELHAAQAGWAAEQARRLAEYFRESGKGDPNSVSGAWPLEPVGAADAVTGTV